MKFFRNIAVVVFPAVCLLGQTTQAPQPTVTTSVEQVKIPPPASNPDKVVLTVGDVKLTAGQFDAIIDTIQEQYRPIARGTGRKQFADNLVRVLVLAQEAKKQKLDQSPAYKAQADFQNANLLASKEFASLSSNVAVDEASLRKYYEEHKQEFERVSAHHILIRMKDTPVPVRPGQKDLTEQEALAKAQDIRKQLAAGADFAKLAEAESDDTGSGSKGGDLGFFQHGQMVPAFEQAAFTLKPGEISQPVKTQFGYHIIRLDAREAKTFADVRNQIEAQIRPDQAKKALEDLTKKAQVTLDPEFFPADTQ
jgi:peptidyl-prolyl cis-trans isomerase C